MLDLRGWLDRRAKVIIKNYTKYIKKSFAKFLEDPDNLDDNAVYLTFKTVTPILYSVSQLVRRVSEGRPSDQQQGHLRTETPSKDTHSQNEWIHL